MKYILFSLIINVNCLLISMDMDHNVCRKLEKAHQKNNLSKYKNCISQLLPFELCKQVDSISALLNKKTIIESYEKNIMRPDESFNLSQHNPIISNDGQYCACTTDYDITLMDIERNCILATVSSGTRKKPISFSKNNEYCVIKSGASGGIWQTTYFYDFIQRYKQSITLKKHYHCSGITISQDSQHILYKDENGGSLSHYTLYTLNTEKKPQEVALKNKCLMGSRAVIFHPDNKHIIHNHYHDKLYLYNIETGEDKIISPEKNEAAYCIAKLTVTSDNKKIIAKTRSRFSDQNGYDAYLYTLFNIENLEKVTSVTIPEQSCGTRKQLPVMVIPHKNMVTHIDNIGHTLQLLDDETLQCMVSHYAKEKFITALAVDTTGNYLAAGYSDGTIMIWHLLNTKKYPNEKIVIDNRGALYPITHLTFGDNQLLLSSVKFEPWDPQNPTPISGNATLWDVYGNEIINFGDNIINSIMSPNAKTIVIASVQLKPGNNFISDWKRYLTLTPYHNKNQTDNYIPHNEYTLSQLYMMTKNNG